MKLYTHIKHILADTKTPVGLYLGLRDKFLSPLLLESSDYNSKEGHYSYICLDPIASIKLQGGLLRTKIAEQIIEEKFSEKDNLNAKIRSFTTLFEVEKQNLPFCYAGLFGYMGYDIINYIEDISLINPKALNIPELFYNFYSVILVFDHQTNSLCLITHAQNKNAALELSQYIEEQILFCEVNSFTFETTNEEKVSCTTDEFKSQVNKAKEHCQQGDVFQLVLSRRFSQDFTGDEFNVYRALKNINPSPYLFYFDMGDLRIFGSSPEAQLVVKNNIAEIHPIAGTYKRTDNVVNDLKKANELLNDPKENSEHMMLVDLARNDLSKFCTNVKVDTLKQTQFYSHVIHLVSKIVGERKNDFDPFELLSGTFPAGTLSGAPKYRSMELIDQYENTAREFYGGCAGFIGLEGEINHAIMIRTFLSKNNTLYYQAGAGIVVSSNEESELNEINNKISALRKAIVNATKFNNIVRPIVSHKDAKTQSLAELTEI